MTSYKKLCTYNFIELKTVNLELYTLMKYLSQVNLKTFSDAQKQRLYHQQTFTVREVKGSSPNGRKKIPDGSLDLYK